MSNVSIERILFAILLQLCINLKIVQFFQIWILYKNYSKTCLMHILSIFKKKYINITSIDFNGFHSIPYLNTTAQNGLNLWNLHIYKTLFLWIVLCKCCANEMLSTLRSFMTLYMFGSGVNLMGAWYKINSA